MAHILHALRKAIVEAAISRLFPSPLLLVSHRAIFLNLIMCFQPGVDLFTGWLGCLVSVAAADGQKPVESGLQEGKEP